MSDTDSDPRPQVPSDRGAKLAAVFAVVLAAVTVGALIGRNFEPPPSATPAAPDRPIVQIMRQPGSLSFADAIARLCPSMATIAPRASSAATAQDKGAPVPIGSPAFAVSSDGWLLASAPLAGKGQLQARFADGRSSAIDEVRLDPVSGLIIAHTQAALQPLSFADQLFARIGDFGFSLNSANGSGCAAQAAMIGSDFLVDARDQGIYIRLQPSLVALDPGSPFFAADGSVAGVATGARDNSLLPSPIASTIVDELIRNSPSPIASFGFRAIDFTPDLAARIGESRARGAGVAMVQPNSAAARAGLKAGDVVLAVDQAPVSSASELSRALDAVIASADLQVARGDRQLTVKVVRSRSNPQN